MTANNIISGAQKVVLKIGSNSLVDDAGHISPSAIEGLAKSVNALLDDGMKVIIVSSGAAAAGAGTMDMLHRKQDINYKQALCAVGQVRLINRWQAAFDKFGKNVAQLLFTAEDFADKTRSLNMRNTIFTLLDEGVIPIVNENDSVSYSEIAIGDNDNLSADTAVLWGADLLVLISDVDGVYTADPATCPNAQKIDIVTDFEALSKQITIGKTNIHGTGGLETKLQAAKKCIDYNIDCVLTNSADNIANGTLFTNSVKGG